MARCQIWAASQWQNASELWGLRVRVTDADGTLMFGGDYAPNPFRDLIFTRAVGLR